MPGCDGHPGPSTARPCGPRSGRPPGRRSAGEKLPTVVSTLVRPAGPPEPPSHRRFSNGYLSLAADRINRNLYRFRIRCRASGRAELSPDGRPSGRSPRETGPDRRCRRPADEPVCHPARQTDPPAAPAPTGPCGPTPRGFRFLPRPGTTPPLPADPPPDPLHPRRVLPGSSPGTGSYPTPTAYSATGGGRTHQARCDSPRSGGRSHTVRRPSRPVRFHPRGRFPVRRCSTDRPAQRRRSRCDPAGIAPAGRDDIRRACSSRDGTGDRPGCSGARSGRGGGLADHGGYLFAVSSLPVRSGLDTNNAAPRLAPT